MTFEEWFSERFKDAKVGPADVEFMAEVKSFCLEAWQRGRKAAVIDCIIALANVKDFSQ